MGWLRKIRDRSRTGPLGLENYLETKQITKYVSDDPWGWYIK